MAINFIGLIPTGASSELHSEMFGENISGIAYCKFLKSKIVLIKYYQNDFGKLDLAKNDWGTILVSEKLLTTKSIVEIASALIHEAFHSNYPRYNGHVVCPEDFLDEKFQGEPFCDDQLFSSYSAQYLWAAMTLKICENCSPGIKSDLEISANWGLSRIISEDVKNILISEVDNAHRAAGAALPSKI